MWSAIQRISALLLLILLAPVLLVLGIAVVVTTGLPIMYKAQRVGRGGQLITVHKFRTMRYEASGPAIATRGDQRVTPLGKSLRKRHLDELPQLWDVARGAMLLVGPRPEDPRFVDLADANWQRILSVPPGITGRSQIEFADEADLILFPNAEEHYKARVLPMKIASDVAYVRTRSVAGDLRIMVKTASHIVRRTPRSNE